MKKLFTAIFITIAYLGFAQNIDMDKLKKDIEKSTKELEVSRKRMDSNLLASAKRMDSVNMVKFNEQNARNLSAFVNERNEKIKKQNRTRIIYFTSMLSIFVIGFILKKRRQKKATNSVNENTTQ